MDKIAGGNQIEKGSAKLSNTQLLSIQKRCHVTHQSEIIKRKRGVST